MPNHCLCAGPASCARSRSRHADQGSGCRRGVCVHVSDRLAHRHSSSAIAPARMAQWARCSSVCSKHRLEAHLVRLPGHLRRSPVPRALPFRPPLPDSTDNSVFHSVRTAAGRRAASAVCAADPPDGVRRRQAAGTLTHFPHHLRPWKQHAVQHDRPSHCSIAAGNVSVQVQKPRGRNHGLTPFHTPTAATAHLLGTDSRLAARYQG